MRPPNRNSLLCYRNILSLKEQGKHLLHPQGLNSLVHSESLDSIKRKKLISICNKTWTQYKLEDNAWPENGSLNYNTIIWLDVFCQKQGNGQRFLMFKFYGLKGEPRTMQAPC